MSNLFVSNELKQVTISGEYWIKCLTDLSVEQIDKITEYFNGTKEQKLSSIQATVKTVLLLMKEWNFAEGKGQPIAEVNEKNLNNLKYSLIEKIMEKIAENNKDLSDLMTKGREIMDKKKDIQS